MRVTPIKTLLKNKERLNENKRNSVNKIAKKFLLIISILIWARTIRRIRLKERRKCGSTVRFYLGNTTRLKYTQVHNKPCHVIHAFSGHSPRKAVKRFNDGIAFNAHVPNYSILEKPKHRMQADA